MPEPKERPLDSRFAPIIIASRRHTARTILTQWHEAYLAWARHPSLAFAAFWGLMEELGRRSIEGSARELGSQRAIAAAFARWAPDLDPAFESKFRHRIAHGTRLYGLEDHNARLISIDLDLSYGLQQGRARLDGDDAHFATAMIGRLASAARDGVLDTILGT